MASLNYDTLKEAVIDYSRGAISESENLDRLIGFAEEDINLGLKHYLAEKVVTLTTTNNVVVLPNDLAEVRTVIIDGQPADPVSAQGGTIDWGCIGYYQISNTYVCVPASVTPRSVEITYYARLPAITEDNKTNWLIDKFGSVYLHATLVRGYRMTGNVDAETAEKASFQEAMAHVYADHDRVTNSGNPIDLGW